jgi:hypothetical protein
LTGGTSGSIFLRIERLLVNIRRAVRLSCFKDAIAMIALQKADSDPPNSQFLEAQAYERHR